MNGQKKEKKISGESRYLIFTFINKDLLDLDEAIESIYLILINNAIYFNFGQRKVIITNGVIGGIEFSLHKNVLVNNHTTLKQILQSNQDDIYKVNVAGSDQDKNDIYTFHVKVWNMDHLQNKDIKITRNSGLFKIETLNKGSIRSFSTSSPVNDKVKGLVDSYITPYKSKTQNEIIPVAKADPTAKINNLKRFVALDIETVNVNGLQIPICITIA